MSEFDNNENNNIYNEPDNTQPEQTENVEDHVETENESTNDSYIDPQPEPSFNDYNEPHNNHTDYQSSAYEEYEERRKKKPARPGRFKAVRLVGAAVAFGLIAGVAMIGVNSVYKSTSSTASKITTTTTSNTSSDSDSSSSSTSGTTTVDVSSIVESVMPSVVSITGTFTSTDSWTGQSSESTGAGSGFIIAKTDDKLMIATNNHVVEDATSLTVGFVDDTTASAEIVGTDSAGDLAVISVDLSDISDDTASTIKIATLGDSDSMSVGDTVIAIGNALGYGQSVTTGVLSAKDREVSFTDGTLTLLQTDAAINPGNSGGVLINTNGEVIGINNAKLADTEVEGMGYAIPMSTAQEILEEIMNNGSIEEEDLAYLGIYGNTVDDTYASVYNMPTGVYVQQVISGSPAEDAGLQAGDIITGFDGASISTMDGLKGKLNLKKYGTEVTLTVQRQDTSGTYSEVEIKVTLGRAGDYSSSTTESTEQSQQQDNNSQYYGNGNDGSSDDSDDSQYYYWFGNGNNGYNQNQSYEIQ